MASQRNASTRALLPAAIDVSLYSRENRTQAINRTPTTISTTATTPIKLTKYPSDSANCPIAKRGAGKSGFDTRGHFRPLGDPTPTAENDEVWHFEEVRARDSFGRKRFWVGAKWYLWGEVGGIVARVTLFGFGWLEKSVGGGFTTP
ncbi:hypothetical protein ACLOJK_009993 [Asimina triloba]